MGESYLRGYFGRANYKLYNKYYAGASIRRDGISQFTPENRWATFYSGSLGWVISDENFFQFEPMNLLKLRGSFGQTGNTNIPSGITSDKWGINSGTTTLEGKNNTFLQSIGNSNIKWETTNSIDAGFDYGFFENRLNGSLAVYQRKVTDMLLAVSLPPSAGISGGNTTWQNIGDMKNDGIEFNINALAVSKNDFTWNIGFNISANRNKVLALDPVSDAKHVGILQSGEGGIVRTITKTGLEWGTYYMAEYAGVDSEKGIPMIYQVKTNEDGTTSHTGEIIPATNENMSNNKMMLQGKSAVPKILGGLTMNFTYKNFDLGVVCSFVSGNYIYNRLLQSSMIPNQGMLVANRKLLTESWTKPGDKTYWPMVTAGNLYNYDNAGNPTTSGVSYGSDNNTPSSQYLENGDYLKLRNLTLGYTVPKQFTDKCKINNVRMYVTANNLLTFTDFSGYNPEIEIDQASGGSYSSFTSLPASRIFMFGLNLNF
jgi:TonB-linked SusC/RagA family outer membrane protein